VACGWLLCSDGGDAAISPFGWDRSRGGAHMAVGGEEGKHVTGGGGRIARGVMDWLVDGVAARRARLAAVAD
jgi:hypothetical protein